MFNVGKPLQRLVAVAAVTCLLSTSHLVRSQSVWDYAPDGIFYDAIPPYPSLTNADGNNISVDNLRGTHLFGFKGCTRDRATTIATAYNDFNTLASQMSVYNSILWSSDAAKDFFGPADGPYRISDDTRRQIQRKSASCRPRGSP